MALIKMLREMFGYNRREVQAKDAYMQATCAKALLQAELRQYDAAIARTKKAIRLVLRTGDEKVASQLAYTLTRYKDKRDSVQNFARDADAIAAAIKSRMTNGFGGCILEGLIADVKQNHVVPHGKAYVMLTKSGRSEKWD